MKVNDAVVYVAPGGDALKGSQLKEFFKKLNDAFESVREIIQKAVKAIRDAFGSIVEAIQPYKNIKIPKRTFGAVPMNTMKPSQVLDRRPLFVNIRSGL